MKSWLAGVVLAGVAALMLPVAADAKRLGGGKSSGMQRAAPDAPAKATPGNAATPAAAPTTPAAAAAPATAGAAAAAAPKRSWMGPIAGLAAGLGIAALMSHLGLGEQFGNFLMLALLALAAVFVVRLLMRRFAGAGNAGMRYAAAGGPSLGAAAPIERSAAPGSSTAAPRSTAPMIGSALQPALAVTGASAAAASALPADFDTAGFERIAKMIFIRLQAANDTADLNDLRTFTTPELFASLRVDLQDRGDRGQHTDVVHVDARVIDYAEEGERQVVSVGFQGRVREEAGAEPVAFDEVWHLVKPLDDSRAWAIAGIQQRQ